MAQEDGEFVDMGWLEAGEAVGGHADQGGVDGLVLAALGGQRQAGGGGDEQEAGVLVAGVDEGIEAAVHERVVDRADGEQAGAGQGMGEAGGAEKQEEVLFGDAEFDVLALGRHAPALGGGQFGVAEDVVAGVAVEDAAAVHPGAEIGGDGDVRAGGDDVGGEVGEFALAAADLGEDVAEAGLGGHLAAGGLRRREGGGDVDCRGGEIAALGGQGRGEGAGVEERLEVVFRDIQPLELVPFVSGADVHDLPEGLHLLLGHHAGMVVLVAGEGQAHALDGVGNEAGGLVALGFGLAEGVDQGFDVVAAEVGHQARRDRRRDNGSMMARTSRERPRSASTAWRQAAPPWKVSAE